MTMVAPGFWANFEPCLKLYANWNPLPSGSGSPT